MGLKQPLSTLHPIHIGYLTHDQYEMISKLKLRPYVIGKCNLMVIQQDNQSLGKLGMLMDEMLDIWIENHKGAARSDNGESRSWVAREVEAHLALQMAQPS